MTCIHGFGGDFAGGAGHPAKSVAELIERDLARWSKLVKDANIKGD